MDDLNGSNGASTLELAGSFEEPPLNPAPVPNLGTAPPELLWACLDILEPIEELPWLAMHVAQLTVVIAALKERIEQLEADAT